MSWPNKQKLIVKWSMWSWCLLSLFWSVWYLVTKQVPFSASGIKVVKEIWTLSFFQIPRWIDALLVSLIWSSAAVLIFTNKKVWNWKNEVISFWGVCIVCLSIVLSTILVPKITPDGDLASLAFMFFLLGGSIGLLIAKGTLLEFLHFLRPDHFDFMILSIFVVSLVVALYHGSFYGLCAGLVSTATGILGAGFAGLIKRCLGLDPKVRRKRHIRFRRHLRLVKS